MSGTSAIGNLSGKEWNVRDRKNFAFGDRRTAAGFLWFMKQGGN